MLLSRCRILEKENAVKKGAEKAGQVHRYITMVAAGDVDIAVGVGP